MCELPALSHARSLASEERPCTYTRNVLTVLCLLSIVFLIFTGTYSQGNNVERLEQLLSKAERLAPAWYEPHCQRGLVYEAENRYTDAIAEMLVFRMRRQLLDNDGCAVYVNVNNPTQGRRFHLAARFVLQCIEWEGKPAIEHEVQPAS